MVRTILALLLVLSPSLLSAGSFRVSAIYFPHSESRSALPTAVATTEFESAFAPEAAISASLFENFEGELSAALIPLDTTFSFREVENTLGQTEFVPISATLVYMKSVGSLELYGGGGVTYALFGEFDEDESGVQGLELSNDTTWHATAGIRLPLNRFALDFGAVYLPVESTFTAPQREPLDIEMDPLLLRAGLRYSF